MLQNVFSVLCVVAAIALIDATPRIRVSQMLPPVQQQRTKGPEKSGRTDCCSNYRGMLQYFSDLSSQADQLANAADSLKMRIAEIQRLIPSSCQPRPTVTPPREKGIPVRRRPETWVPPPVTRRPTSLTTTYPRSCLEWIQRDGPARNGERFAIDPYGRGNAVYVRCIFYAEYVTTEIGPGTQFRIDGPASCYDRYDSIEGEEDICERRDVEYGSLNRNDIHSIMAVSGTCSQSVTWDCHASKLLYLGNGRDVTVYGETIRGQENDLQQGVCACSDSRNCTDPTKNCHCSSKEDKWSLDEIVISGGENNVNLPIYEVIVGDIDGKREAVQVSVHNIRCMQSVNGDRLERSRYVQNGTPSDGARPDRGGNREESEQTPPAPAIQVATSAP